MLLFMTIMTVALTGTDTEPVFVLDHPGVAFGSMPLELEEPVTGNLNPEAGVMESSPNATGTEFHVMYWLEEPIDTGARSQWLEERLQTVLPPDILPQIILGSPDWMEGSVASPQRESGSLGLMPTLNFNIVEENGAVLGAGRAAAFFRGGYSVLIYCIAPASQSAFVRDNLDAMISQMYLL